MIKDAIAFLINAEDLTIGRITTSRIQFFQLLNILCALFAHRSKNQEQVDSLRDILEKCYQCSRRRNTLVHSFWYADIGDAVAKRFEIRVNRGKQSYNEDDEVVSTERLERDAKEFELTRRELQQFLVRTFDQYDPALYPTER